MTAGSCLGIAWWSMNSTKNDLPAPVRQDQIGDQTTADVFTEIPRSIDKHLWFVEAYLAGSHEHGLGPPPENHE